MDQKTIHKIAYRLNVAESKAQKGSTKHQENDHDIIMKMPRIQESTLKKIEEAAGFNLTFFTRRRWKGRWIHIHGIKLEGSTTQRNQILNEVYLSLLESFVHSGNPDFDNFLVEIGYFNTPPLTKEK